MPPFESRAVGRFDHERDAGLLLQGMSQFDGDDPAGTVLLVPRRGRDWLKLDLVTPI